MVLKYDQKISPSNYCKALQKKEEKDKKMGINHFNNRTYFEYVYLFAIKFYNKKGTKRNK